MKWVLLDYGFSPRVAELLREAGWDAQHAAEIYLQEAPDETLLARARVESRVLIALGRDFPSILALTAAAPPAVVSIRQTGLGAAQTAELIAAIWRDHEAALDAGCLLTAGGERTWRIQPLPIATKPIPPPDSPAAS